MNRNYTYSATVRDPETRTSSSKTGEISVPVTPTATSDAEAAARGRVESQNPGGHVTAVRAWRSDS